MPPYIMLEKKVGETPLSCMEAWREKHPAYAGVALAYAGRLDPMASGQLLVLVGDECKHQEHYHGLDKEYTFRILFGVSSDSGDVLGLVREGGTRTVSKEAVRQSIAMFVGPISLPYPLFSSRTVHGKPLHTWAVEGRQNEIDIPTKHSTVYTLRLDALHTTSREAVVAEARHNIELIPPVTDLRKAIGNDFRRVDVRAAWDMVAKSGEPSDVFCIATMTAIASSGTYMRSLAEAVAKELGTTGLAFSIHRTTIGRYDGIEQVWKEIFR